MVGRRVGGVVKQIKRTKMTTHVLKKKDIPGTSVQLGGRGRSQDDESAGQFMRLCKILHVCVEKLI